MHTAISPRVSEGAPPALHSQLPSSVSRALTALLAEQRPDGCWEGEMVWCTMILSQYVIVQRLLGRPIAPERAAGMVRHFQVTRTADGAWGLHGESGGYVFTTVLGYVALRLLGVTAADPLCRDALRWLRGQPGGVLSVPTWGKLWLSLCGLYEWDGVNPFPPELFLMPEALPLHPDRYYCHTRYIYLAIAYLYGARYRGDLGPITADLQEELYDGRYQSIDFAAHRHDLAASDLYVRPSGALRLAYEALRLYERVHNKRLRYAALERCFRRILWEMRATRFHGLSPVNGLLSCLAIAAHGGITPHPGEARPASPGDGTERSEAPLLEQALAGMEAWRWEDTAEGVRYAGARSNAWDTAFAVQATLAALPAGGCAEGDADGRRALLALRDGYRYLRDTQLREDVPGSAEERRDPQRGGWCFSDGQHRWPVSDCTAEALSAILGVHSAADQGALTLAADERVPDEWLAQAVRFILQRQNDDGGFGSYERRRGGALLEAINPSEMYGSCMTERSYLECTASCVEALCRFRQVGPLAQELRAEIDEAVGRAVGLIRLAQRPDGGFPGFWGINFTYGAFHAVRALRAAGVPREDECLRAAASWLVAHQRPDGGFGEHYTGCLRGEYVEHPHSQVVMTSWALLALRELLPPDDRAVQRAASWLRGQQQAAGGFPQQAQNGVFFGTAMLDYRLYKSYFPLWALAGLPEGERTEDERAAA